jgi:hypothetical protein
MARGERYGWICPRCETAYTPDKEMCGCVPNPVIDSEKKLHWKDFCTGDAWYDVRKWQREK